MTGLICFSVTGVRFSWYSVAIVVPSAAWMMRLLRQRRRLQVLRQVLHGVVGLRRGHPGQARQGERQAGDESSRHRTHHEENEHRLNDVGPSSPLAFVHGPADYGRTRVSGTLFVTEFTIRAAIHH
jgi:hypothetical protein